MIIAVSSLVAERYGERIRAAAPGARLVHPTADGWPEEAQAAEIAYFSEDFWTSETNRQLVPMLFGLPRLRWFHSFSAGIDHPVFRVVLERGALLTNSPGSSSQPIAQYVIGMMLRVAKRMDVWAEQQRERRWQPIETDELTGKTVGIVGVGHIGGEVARLAKAFGMQVIGCRRRPRPPRFVDELVPPERLPELLGRSDFVVLAVPLSVQTDGLIDDAALRSMSPHAWLINVSRGRIVREDALVRALAGGTIAGACLDVFEEEPLPEMSPLWSMPNAIVTPHNSGWSPLNLERGTGVFLDNLGRYVAGRSLQNQIRLPDL